MSLEGLPLPAGSDNLKVDAVPVAGGSSSGLDAFRADTWSNAHAFQMTDAAVNQPISQLFDMPGVPGPYVEQPIALARQLDKGFSSRDVVSVIKESMEQNGQSTELTRSACNIKVVYVDKEYAYKNDADFRIEKDGSLTIRENKDLLNKKDLVIAVERPEGYVGAPDKDQQASLNTLVKSLADNLLDKQGKVEDPMGLISDALKKILEAHPAPEAHFPQAMQQAMHNMQRFAGGGSGQMTSREADDYFPERQVERLENESNEQVSLKDAIAGFATRGEREPYYAVRNFGDRGCGVGRYMFTADLLLEWLEDLFSGCGNPPDATKVLAKLLKTMKNKKLAAKCAETLAKAAQSGELKTFLNDLKSGKLKAGDAQTKAAIEKFLPKELQEAAASQLLDKLAKTGADPSKIAMHMLLGHEPTKEDMAKPEYQQLKDSFERLNAIADTRTNHPHEDIKWQDNGGKLECAPLHGRVTDHFGHRDHHPVTGGHADHNGVDLALSNDKIPALMSGRVESAGYAGKAGYKVTIDHGDGVKTVYMHMQPNLKVHAGQKVTQGTLIGYQGATGSVTGKHLHLGLYMNGKAVDPLKHLNINT